MQKAGNGNTVRVHYTGKFSNGSVFDSSIEHEPLEFEIGSHQVIEGFENAVSGMQIGEKKTVAFPPEQGYGERSEDLLFEISNEELPEQFEPKIGMPVEMMNHEGETLIASIIDVNETGIKMDGNHPLAGKHLTFDLELMEIIS